MYKEIAVNDFLTNPFDLKKDWMLVTSEYEGKTNTMTASWGGVGVMWNKEVVFIVVRPQRYTKGFIDKSHKFTLSFFDKKYQKDLAYLGKVSGRNENKIKKTSLTPKLINNYPTFSEAKLIINANVLYIQEMKEESFLAPEIVERWYPEKDFHFLYIAEVDSIFTKELDY